MVCVCVCLYDVWFVCVCLYDVWFVCVCMMCGLYVCIYGLVCVFNLGQFCLHHVYVLSSSHLFFFTVEISGVTCFVT